LNLFLKPDAGVLAPYKLKEYFSLMEFQMRGIFTYACTSILTTFFRVSFAFINLQLPETADILGSKVLDSATALKHGTSSAGENFRSRALATFGGSVSSRADESATELKCVMVSAG